MADRLPFLDELTKGLGTGGMAGGVLGAIGAAIIAAVSGGGFMSLLMIPLVALTGAAIGDYKTQDGFLFGEHGIVKTWQRKDDPKTIPEGYIAANPFARDSGADSQVLARTGEFHMPIPKRPDEVFLGYKEARHLDKFPELDMNGDPRFEALKEKARGYKKRYADENSPDYIADTRKRERFITNLVVHDVGETYGPYSKSKIDLICNSAEAKSIFHPANLVLGQQSVKLKDIEKGSLVCRYFAPITGVLLEEAGVPNYVVGSAVRDVHNEAGVFSLKDKGAFGNIFREHAYIITKSNAIVEATRAGSDYEAWAYRRIANGVTAEDVAVHGKGAIPYIRHKEKDWIYGGHTGDGRAGSDSINLVGEMLRSSENAEAGMQRSVDQFNTQMANLKHVATKITDEAKQLAGPVKAMVKETLGGLSFIIPGSLSSADEPQAQAANTAAPQQASIQPK